MKTIQIKVSIDGVNYLSKMYNHESEKHIECRINNYLGWKYGFSFKDERENEIYFGSELIKKSIITIIEL